MLYRQRLSAEMEGEFVVFLIGMRLNRPWKVHRWLPVMLSMPRMLRELMTSKDSGLLSGEMWLGRTTIMVQYWESKEKLFAYASDKNAEHLPAWKAFNKKVGTNGDVGVWHETYLVSPDTYENVYVNMPAFGLGKAGTLHRASGRRWGADHRPVADRRPPTVPAAGADQA
jgi:hypothetical protein